MSVYIEADEERGERTRCSRSWKTATELELAGSCERNQHFTQPPAHYTEASLVKAMEEQGIGRPSTYAPTITTIIGPPLCGKGK